MIGTTVSHFRILERLGSGGMGEVYLAQDTTLERLVALKFISDEMMRSDPLAGERFLREAKAVAALNHPHICTIFETGEFEGRPFLAMEYLKGRTLRAHISARPLEQETVSSVGLQLADALAEAHSKGILHRDLKPENVFVADKTSVKLLDFGLAKWIDESLVSDRSDDVAVSLEDRTIAMSPRENRLDLPTITRTGVLVGTVSYMSPEQARGERLDSRSDLFSLGAVLYESVTGKAAFGGNSTMEVLTSILRDTPPPPRLLRPDVSPGLSALIEQLLEKSPDKRFESAARVRDALVSATSGATANGGHASRLPTLGVKRSSLHAWIFTVGLIVCVEWLVFTMVLGHSLGGAARWLGIGGVLCMVLSFVVWRVSLKQGNREISARLVRLQALPESSRRPAVIWWTAVASAALSTLAIAFIIMVWLFGDSTSPGDQSSSRALLIRMFPFYLPVAAISWALVLRSRGWRGRPHTRWRRTLDLDVEGTYAQVLARCSRALSAVGAHVTGLDLDSGHIEARTSTTVLGWGEKITLQVQPSGVQTLCSIALESDCLNPVQLTDYGKNARNLRTVAEALVQ